MKFMDMKLKTKQWIIFGSILMMLVIVYFISIYRMSMLKSDLDEITTNRLPAIIAISDMNLNISELRRTQLQHAYSSSDSLKRHYEGLMITLIERVMENIDSYNQLISDQEEREYYQMFDREWEKYLDLSNTVLDLSRENRMQDALLMLNTDVREVFNELTTDLLKLVEINRSVSFDAAERAEVTFEDYKSLFTHILIFVTIFIILVSMGLARLINRPIKKLEYAAKSVSEGDLNVNIDSIIRKDEVGTLATSFNQMTHSLREAKKESEDTDWLKTGVNELNVKMRGDQDVAALAQNIITYLAQYLNSQVGTIYLVDETWKHLILTGSFALSETTEKKAKIKIGDGLLGQAALDKELLHIKEVPEDYFHIDSSTGSILPRNIVIKPFIFEGALTGVIELGSLKDFTSRELEFLNVVMENIATGIHSAQSRNQIKKLLEETVSMADRLNEQQGELKRANEELEDQAKALTKSEEKLKQALDASEVASRSKSEFLANMSHEIRTPLNAVLGFSDLLDSLISDPKQKNYVEAIKSSGKNLLTLINDILDLSKIEAGKLEIQYEPVNPYTVFNEIQQIFALKISQKGLDFEIDIDSDIPESILLDEARLRQILFNLIGNAIKYTEEGFIKLSSKKIYTLDDKSTLDFIISVEDSGIGIPPESQKKIFESFKQQEGQSVKKYGGTGLGLTISKRLVEMMGGEINVRSKVNEGSIFEIVLKDISVSSVKPQESEVVIRDAADIDFEPARILLGDDIVHNRILVKEYFSNTRIEIVEAENGKEVIEKAHEKRPDVILLDMRMPVMDGYEAFEKLRAHEKSNDIPVVALTASALKQDRDKILNKGFDGYLRKPVQRSDLFRELTRFLKFTDKNDTGKKAEPEKNTMAPIDISDNTRAKLPEITSELQEIFIPLWEKIRNFNNIDDFKDFGIRLKELGANNTLDMLEEYGAGIQEYAENFDIEQLNSEVESFTALIDRIKEL